MSSLTIAFEWPVEGINSFAHFVRPEKWLFEVFFSFRMQLHQLPLGLLPVKILIVLFGVWCLLIGSRSDHRSDGLTRNTFPFVERICFDSLFSLVSLRKSVTKVARMANGERDGVWLGVTLSNYGSSGGGDLSRCCG